MNFGPHKVPLNNVIYKTEYTYVFTNLMPVAEGHILVAPIRSVSLFHDLANEEKTDFLKVLEFASRVMKKHLHTQALNLTIQDGPEAGQTVPHVHCHIIPLNLPPTFKKQYPDDATREQTTNQYKEFFNKELAIIQKKVA